MSKRAKTPRNHMLLREIVTFTTSNTLTSKGAPSSSRIHPSIETTIPLSAKLPLIIGRVTPECTRFKWALVNVPPGAGWARLQWGDPPGNPIAWWTIKSVNSASSSREVFIVVFRSNGLSILGMVEICAERSVRWGWAWQKDTTTALDLAGMY